MLMRFGAVFVALIALIVVGCGDGVAGMGATKPNETLGTSSASQPVTRDDVASSFIEALLRKDYAALRPYAGGDGSGFFVGERLDPEIESFLYQDDPASGTRSASQIVGAEGYRFKIIPQEDQVFTVLYVRSEDFPNLESAEFLEAEWMKRYFACEFIADGARYRLHQNFCFAETDGPFPGDYG
jgi:hypothetical protein